MDSVGSWLGCGGWEVGQDKVLTYSGRPRTRTGGVKHLLDWDVWKDSELQLPD